jgi:uroporphyrinogen decarboxylase
MAPSGYYFELEVSPLAGDLRLPDIDRYPWPDAADEGRWRGVAERARRLREETDYAVVGHAPGGWIHISQYLRGFEDWYVDFAAQPEVAAALMRRVRDLTLEMARRFLDAAGPYLDVVATGDDIGAQHSLQVSPAMYREMILPLQREQFRTFHDLTDARVFYHTCGDVYPVIDDLIDIGVDILNPVQVSAAEMGDTKRLKAEFGDRLSFWGGVDNVDVLPNGSVEDVGREVDLRTADLGRDGGYVLCPVHNVQPDVPVENLLALYERGRSLRGVAV